MRVIVDDIKALYKKRESLFEEILNSEPIQLERKSIAFIFFMNVYYVFIPAFLVIFNIVVFLAFLVLAGMGYYFAQELFIMYKDRRTFETEDEDRVFYTVAYCLALANVPAFAYLFVVNFIIFLFTFIFTQNQLIGVFLSLLLSAPALIGALYFPLKLLKILSDKEYNLELFSEMLLSSFVRSVNEWLGFKAVQEMWVDYRSAPKH